MLRWKQPKRSRYALALLATTVVVLAWLQFQWLSQLRDEEVARRQVALRVAARSFGEGVDAELRRLLTAPESLPTGGTRVAWQPGSGTGRLALDDGSFRPLGVAELQQRLGRALASRPPPGAGLWLDPLAVVTCTHRCSAFLPPTEWIDGGLLGAIADRMFSEFGEILAVEVLVTTGAERESVDENGPAFAPRRILYASRPESRTAGPPDLALVLLPDAPVLGPAATRWELRLSHAGSSLESLVGRAHARNLVISLTVLAVLVGGLWLVVAGARRRAALAERQVTFVASASHELRTPLAVIASAADNLADGAITDPERVRAYGELVRGEARRLSSMVETVLQYAESTFRPLDLSPVDVAALIAGACAEAEASTRGKEVRIDLAPDLPEVPGDARALRSLLVNLLVNAAKYAEGEHWIAISARVVAAARGRKVLALSVVNPVRSRLESDPGRWFEAFRRDRSAEERGIPGTGIGLAVARNIARQHGGGLNVDVQPRRSVRFTLYLPLDALESAA